MKKLFFLFSALLFAGTVLSQSITLTSPNGGQTWAGCTSQTITWNSSGTSDYYSLDYSTDNGSSWTSITSYYNTTSGSYSWTVPNTSSGICLIRITDSNNSGTSDVSDAVFTITSPLTVSSPNGGETWEGSTAENITFTKNGTSNYYDISYSTDAGGNWTSIAYNKYISGTSTNWNIPNTPSVQCLVKISDHSNACMTDVSDGLFEIIEAASSVTITSPNGGQVWYVGANQTITWTASNTSNLYNLDYSTDNGASWTSLASNYSGTSFSWIIPNTPSTNCLVRVMDSNDNPVQDQSNSTFTIAEPYITVVYPNGGENFEGCSDEYINWQNGGTGNYYRIEYSTDNGASWNTLSTSFYSSGSSGSFNWDPIPSIDTDLCLIRVTDKNNTSVLDQSDAAFSIEANDDIVITSPNGGENWDVGTDHDISWVSASTTTRYYVYYSVNDGSSWTNLTNTYSNTYNWTIPDNETNQALVRVVDYYNSCILDESDANFNITPPTPVITVTNPNSATTWYQNNNYTIQWNSEYVESHYVTLYYSTDNGSTWNIIESITEDDGSYSWIAPEVVSSNCLIKVEEYDNPAVYDVSDTNFSIAEQYITVTAPNGGESWEGCSDHYIAWQTNGTGNYFDIELSTDNGATWEPLASSVYQSGTSCSYNWDPVDDLTSSQCLIRVFDRNDNTIIDQSDAIFSLNENLHIITTTPNGGEAWQVGSTQTISWVSSSTSDRFSVHYSTNDGSTWTTLTNSTYSESYNWTIPDNVSDLCLIRVRDYDNNCIYDISDANFSITPPTPEINITSPNSGNTLYARNNYSISWLNAYNDVDFVTLEYSTDNGSTWTEIIDVTENDGSYSWTTPDVVSSECQIRISDYSNASFFDITDVNFSIIQPFASITSPNGGENLLGCDDTYIQWTSGGAGNYWEIEYSTDNGVNWTVLSSSAYESGTTHSYTWDPIDNVSSSECIFRVRDRDDNLIEDSSDDVFSINPNTDIIVTNPNGGEIFEVGDSYSLSWVSSSSSDRFRVYYSTNNGSTWTLITSTYSDSYNWTVPNIPSTDCLIKVVDYYNTCIFDVSDANFTISEPLPEITVNYPNSGTYYYNNNMSISWDSEYLTSEFVQIEVSYDNGGSWEMIESPTQDDGSYSWTCPELETTEGLIRVSEYGNPSVYDVTDANFTITQPWVTITYPNGGESLNGCESENITWTSLGTGNYFDIELSTDNGNTWTTIANSVYNSPSSGNYSWNPVSDLSTTECLIRITDHNYATATDVSDATFSLNENTDIVVTSPNGGENWEVGTSQTITWASSLGSNKYDIYYSVDNGNSWNYIDYTYSTNFNWTIPDNVSDNCQIRVWDDDNTCIRDVNDANFSIIPPTPVIEVTNPVSGTFYVGNTYNITWNSEYIESDFVSIEFSSDNGSTWEEIVSLTEDDGIYNWEAPNTLSTECVIRISEYGNPAVNDIGTNFTITNPYITITSPNGGEYFEECESMTITWQRGGTSNYYRIEYSTNGGADWNTITNSAYVSGTSYNWSTIQNADSDNCIIRVTDRDRPIATDVSDAPFEIDVNEDIILTSPNGGEFWQVGTSHNIEWVSASTSTRFKVYVSVNDGAWNLLTSTYSNYYNYNIPNNPSSQYKIKVEDYYNSCIYDESDDYFTVTPGDVALNYPNGGNTFYVGSNYNITWTDEYIDGNYVKLEYSSNNGASWHNIVSVTENDGSYSWNIPNDISDECLVKVTHFNDESIFDISDDVFSIEPSIILITPNGDGGGEVWRVCTETSITWTSGGTGNYFKIEYSIDNGLSWNTIQSSYYSSGYNNSYNWTLPNTPSSECLVRVTDNSSSIKTDVSDATFTISPAITLTQPNGGESLTNGSTYDILWNSDGVSNFYNIDYSIDGGNNWTNIVFNQNITSDSYSWTVPGSVSQNCLIKVTDNVNTCKTDMSDQVFAIGTAAIDITVDAPAGGEVWNGCTIQTISWTSVGTSNDYDLAYSIDGGASWTSIVDDYNTTLNTYDWTVPNENSANCLIRVRDANNANFYGISPAEFEIASVIADAGEDFALCMGDSQQLSASGGVTYAWLPTNGLSDPNIADPMANPTSTTTYTVFVTDANGCTDSDEITITVNPIPASPVAGSNSPVPLNGTLELTASTVVFANYTWSGPNGFTSNMQNPEISNATSALDGTYEVIAIVYGCESAPASTVVSVSGSPASINLNGAVITENSSPINGVSLELTGDLSDSFTTNTDGLYTFAVDNGGAYEIAASKNNDVTTNNGVSTLDIILMQRHILGVQALSSPYKIIAADVNRSESVSTLDILYTRALILQTASSFPGGDLWTFVNSDYLFPDAQNPFPYEQTRSYSSATELADQNFIGIKLGDVNNSWNNNIAKSGTEHLNFRIENNNASFEETIEIPVYADNFNNISGFQMSIEWDEDKLEFVEIENQAIELFFNSNYLSNGMLSCLWSTENVNGINLDSEAVLFTMTFEVISDFSETATIHFNAAMTEAEAYNHELEIMDIQLVGGEIILNNYLNLNENNLSAVLNAYPNPFSESTRLAFYLPEAAKVNFELYSITGKCIWTYSQSYMSGKHSLEFNGRNKQGEKLSPGTYILRFRANNTLKNHKLIIQ
jgi:hypothetical protein